MRRTSLLLAAIVSCLIAATSVVVARSGAQEPARASGSSGVDRLPPRAPDAGRAGGASPADPAGRASAPDAADTKSRAGAQGLEDLLVLQQKPDGYVLDPGTSGPLTIEDAALHLFGSRSNRAWLERERFIGGYERTYVQTARPHRIVAMTIYRFAKQDAPMRLEQMPGPGESAFEVEDYGGYRTTGTDATAATSRRLGRRVPDFVVRSDIGGYMFFNEMAGSGIDADDVRGLALEQYRRAAARLPGID